VDGRPRADGVRAFLASRGIEADASTVERLAARKEQAFRALVRRGVDRYEDAVRFAERTGVRGLRRGVVSSSSHCREVLEAAGIAGLFEIVVDGVVAAREGLAGKPAPDTFLAAACRLGARPPETAVLEDAVAGVQAARAGGFGWIAAVDRTGHGKQLRRAGADAVVRDLDAISWSRPGARAARARPAS
jgi:HAD superfamily hydrolase (TIGR01509 family)